MNTKPEEIVMLTRLERIQIADILRGAANEIAGFYDKNRSDMPRRAQVGMDREIERLRKLSERVKPPLLPEEEDDFRIESDR